MEVSPVLDTSFSSSHNHFYLSYDNGAYNFRRRNPRFSWEELQILAQETSKNFELLRQKETDDSVKQMKQRVWNVITEKVNAVNRSNSRREPLQLKRKWIEARSRVRHKLIASYRRRIGSQDLSTSAGSSSTHGSPSGAAAKVNGDSPSPARPPRPSSAATPVELSYFEKLLTLSMSDELQDEEMRIACQYRQLKDQQNSHPSRIPVPNQHLQMARSIKGRSRSTEEEDTSQDLNEDDLEYDDGPSCLTMTPEEMSNEGQHGDVEMLHVGNEDDELEILSHQGQVSGSRYETRHKVKDDVANEIFISGADSAVNDGLQSQSRQCLLCGSGSSSSMEKMLAERHNLKLNILHNKAHYWFAKCRQVAPEAAIPPPVNNSFSYHPPSSASARMFELSRNIVKQEQGGGHSGN